MGLRPSKRSEILGEVNAGKPLRDISNTYGVSLSTIKYTKRKASERDQDQHDLPRQGRPRKTSKQYDTRLVRSLKRHTTEPWSATLENASISKATIQRRISEIDPELRHKQRRWRIYLTRGDARKRLNYEQRNRCWRVEDWANVWWSDECSTEIRKGEVRKWAWMHTGEQYEQASD